MWLCRAGLAALQNALWPTIRQHGKPMTFNDIRAVIRKQFEIDGTKYSSFEWSLLHSSLERSMRRALHRMVRDDMVVAFGDGGRGSVSLFRSPHWDINHVRQARSTDPFGGTREPTPGSNEALFKLMLKDRAASFLAYESQTD